MLKSMGSLSGETDTVFDFVGFKQHWIFFLFHYAFFQHKISQRVFDQLLELAADIAGSVFFTEAFEGNIVYYRNRRNNLDTFFDKAIIYLINQDSGNLAAVRFIQPAEDDGIVYPV